MLVAAELYLPSYQIPAATLLMADHSSCRIQLMEKATRRGASLTAAEARTEDRRSHNVDYATVVQGKGREEPVLR